MFKQLLFAQLMTATTTRRNFGLLQRLGMTLPMTTNITTRSSLNYLWIICILSNILQSSQLHFWDSEMNIYRHLGYVTDG